jgi:hypothetical protein
MCTAVGIFLCILCRLEASRVRVELVISTLTLLAASRHNTHKNIPTAVHIVPPDQQKSA